MMSDSRQKGEAMDIEQLLKEGPSLTLNPEEEFSDLAVEEPKKKNI